MYLRILDTDTRDMWCGPRRKYDTPMAAILNALYGHGLADDEAGSVDTDGIHMARFGRRVLFTHPDGGCGSHRFDTVADADAALETVRHDWLD